MLQKSVLLVFLLTAFSVNFTSAQSLPFEANWESLENYKIPEWYKDAKFGIFIHWGVYSVPAFRNEWYPHLMYKKGSDVYDHHIQNHGPQSEFGLRPGRI